MMVNLEVLHCCPQLLYYIHHPTFSDRWTVVGLATTSVGIELKELGVRCRNVWNFTQGLKFKANFDSKMIVCRHERGFNPLPGNSSPGYKPTTY